MKFTLEHSVIAVVALALIYYMIKHRNLLVDLVSIPDRDHPELKVVTRKHLSARPVYRLNESQNAYAEKNKITSYYQFTKDSQRGCIFRKHGAKCYTNDDYVQQGYCSEGKARCVGYPHDIREEKDYIEVVDPWDWPNPVQDDHRDLYNKGTWCPSGQKRHWIYKDGFQTGKSGCYWD